MLIHGQSMITMNRKHGLIKRSQTSWCPLTPSFCGSSPFSCVFLDADIVPSNPQWSLEITPDSQLAIEIQERSNPQTWAFHYQHIKLHDLGSSFYLVMYVLSFHSERPSSVDAFMFSFIVSEWVPNIQDFDLGDYTWTHSL